MSVGILRLPGIGFTSQKVSTQRLDKYGWANKTHTDEKTYAKQGISSGTPTAECEEHHWHMVDYF